MKQNAMMLAPRTVGIKLRLTWHDHIKMLCSAVTEASFKENRERCAGE